MTAPTWPDTFELDPTTGVPLFVHAKDCPSACGYACNPRGVEEAEAAAGARGEGR